MSSVARVGTAVTWKPCSQVARQQVAQAHVVVDDEDAGLQLRHGQYIGYKNFPTTGTGYQLLHARDPPSYHPDVNAKALAVLSLAMLLAVALAAGSALGQNKGGRDERKQQPQRQMKQEERQRIREDVRDAYRDRQARRGRPRQMSPEERGKLRRDIEDANRQLRK